jgi:two-component system response regulator BaeR
MTPTHILIVEDEVKIAALLKDYLSRAGHSVTVLGRGDQVAAQMARTPPDLILLDVMLPGKDGLEVCRDIRRTSRVPIIMLTARVEEVDRLVGLELGADDYICKPFSPREVAARVKAVLRRTRPQPEGAPLVQGPLTLDPAAHQVTVAGRELDLTPSEFGLLEVLMASPQRVFARSELLNKVQGYQFEGYERTIDSHVKNLRRKIAAALPQVEVIRTVYGVGYKFVSLE